MAGAPCRVEGFEGAGIANPRGRALVIFDPSALKAFLHGQRPAYFNPAGAMVEICHALTEAGLVVDAIGIDDSAFAPTRSYGILVAHAGPAYTKLADTLGAKCRVIDYSTGCHWKAYNAQSEERYRRFAERRKLPMADSWQRPLVLEHEDYAAARADVVVCLGKETARTFEPVARRVVAVNNSAFIQALQRPSAITERMRRSFYYQGGPGNVQKGLDLLIEAFAAEPDFHFYFDSTIDAELLKTYGRELRRPNLHYSKWSTDIPGGEARLVQKCAFLIHAGMNSGQSTALVGNLAHGFVPVVTRESNLGLDEVSVPIASATVPDIRAAIRTAAQLPAEEIARRRPLVTAAFHEQFSPAAYRAGFRSAIESLLP
jgi:hypothetical protein